MIVYLEREWQVRACEIDDPVGLSSPTQQWGPAQEWSVVGSCSRQNELSLREDWLSVLWADTIVVSRRYQSVQARTRIRRKGWG